MPGPNGESRRVSDRSPWARFYFGPWSEYLRDLFMTVAIGLALGALIASKAQQDETDKTTNRAAATAREAHRTGAQVKSSALRTCRRVNVQNAYTRGEVKTSADLVRRYPGLAARFGLSEREVQTVFKREKLVNAVFAIQDCDGALATSRPKRLSNKDERLYIDVIIKARAPIIDKGHVVGSRPFPREGPPTEAANSPPARR